MFAAAIALLVPAFALAPNPSAPAADAATYAGVRLTVVGQSTVVRTGTRRDVVAGRFEHARLARGFAPDGRAIASGDVVLEDTANHRTRATSRFAVVDGDGATAPKVLELRGDFGYDAISPDGRTLFLTSYFSVERPKWYAVRAIDIATGRMDPNIVADKSAALEGPMEGSPVARAITSAGDWVYTAYRGGGDHDFVHALATTGPVRTAVCIDFPHDVHAEDWRLRLDESRSRLIATSRSAKARLVISTRDFTVRQQ